MKRIFVILSIIVFGFSSFSQEKSKVKITLLGTFHFSQVHNSENKNTNFFGESVQTDVEQVIAKLKAYKPDQIYIEREPKIQKSVDSLFLLYRSDKLKLKDIKNGSGEVYQIAFRLANELDLPAPSCVDYYQSTSQSLLNFGNNIEKYQMALQDFQQLGRNVVGDFIKGKSSLSTTLALMNTTQNITKSHRLLFNIPAYVKDGGFKNYKNIDSTLVDKRYIGAEFITLFYERNLKIYSNILNTQLENGGKRILLIVGQTHVGVLQELLANNPDFEVVPINNFLKQ